MSYATTLDEVLALRSENFHLRDRLSLARKECAIMRDMLLNPDPESEPDVVRLHREKCDEITKRIEAETELAALRASAVAEPVAIVHQINGPFASPVAHPAPAAPVPASDRSAFEKIVRSVCALDAPPNDGDEYEKGIHNAGLDILTALASLPAPEASPTGEEIAKIVYDAFPFEPRHGLPGKPLWVDGGNSFMQEDARRAADRILALKAAPAK